MPSDEIRSPRWYRSPKLLAALTLLAIIAAVAGGWAYRQHHRYKHFAIHEAGRVYRSAWVEGEVFEELIPHYGVKTVVNLCEPGEMGDRISDERRAVSAAGAKLIELPFPLNHTWTTDHPAVDEMQRILADESNYPIWIHCQHGRERTAKAVAMYDILHRDRSAEDSLEKQPSFGMDHPWHVIVFAYNFETKHTGQAADRLVEKRRAAAAR